MDTPAFDFVCDQLEARTSLSRLEARGTVRLAFKAAGLEPAGVTGEQVRVLLEKVLPGELASRGIGDGAALCRSLVPEASGLAAGSGAQSAEVIFARLGGG